MSRLRVALLAFAVALGSALAYTYFGASTEMMSLSTAGVPGDKASIDPEISGNGRYVAFLSAATNLVPGDTNAFTDVFVRDRTADTTTRVSLTNGGAEAANHSGNCSISFDGRYVAFDSLANNLVVGDTGRQDIFVRDTVANTTERISIGIGGVQPSDFSSGPSISGTGRYVAFWSHANNLVLNDTNITYDVFVRDRTSGTTTRASVATGGGQANNGSAWPRITADGRYVAFHSNASNLVPGDTNGWSDVFVHDRATNSTTRVSVATGGGQANGESGGPAISDNGRYVAFESSATNLVPGDTNAKDDIFLHDRQTGTTKRLSQVGAVEANNQSAHAAVSGDGRFVGFSSLAWNLVPNDNNAYWDVFVYSVQTGALVRESLKTDGSEGNGTRPSLSDSGRLVAMRSLAKLALEDTNGVEDVFVRDRVNPVSVVSTSPASGVPITVWTPDFYGSGNGSTTFNRSYQSGSTMSMTAPNQSGTNWFLRWEKNGAAIGSGARTVSTTIQGDTTMRAVFAPNRALTIGSLDPPSGVPITVWTADKYGLKNGTTTFTRNYAHGTQVSVTAPSVQGNSYFIRWNLEGSPFSALKTISIAMSGDRSLTAVYTPGKTLTVTSANPSTGVQIVVSKTDKAGLKDGTTGFTRLYAANDQVSLTAPATAAGHPFLKWELNGVGLTTNRTCMVTVNGNHSLRALYSP